MKGTVRVEKEGGYLEAGLGVDGLEGNQSKEETKEIAKLLQDFNPVKSKWIAEWGKERFVVCFFDKGFAMQLESTDRTEVIELVKRYDAYKTKLQNWLEVE